MGVEKLKSCINRQRLVETAVKLIAVPSRTGEAGAVSNCLADLLCADGFFVERPTAGYPAAPAVVVRWQTKNPGPTLQFNGHLDTVHLPFVPPQVAEGKITGSGSSDMKAGLAAAIEALRALRESQVLQAGGILLTAHDLHETPWGDGRQLNRLIQDGIVGDAVLLPEYLHESLPVVGRGGLTWKITICRPGPPIHEVMRPAEPNVIAVGAELIRRLQQLDQKISTKRHPLAGAESVFIGQIHSGEIFNQYPQECKLEGTRRWLPGSSLDEVQSELRNLCVGLAKETGTAITCDMFLMRDAFELPQSDFVAAFQDAYCETAGKVLRIGAKPFCDDGNSFWALAKIPAITHGPKAGGAHTLNEWVSIDDLVRVAQVYALTALNFCSKPPADS
jgi:acetylornithine deacetylase/succinyl-diaminopimelate desuccinylase-like protein